jgi:pyruvate dehydrogenase E1 component alpha subunit
MLARTGYTPDQLIAFEQRVAAAFNEGEIHAPVHLSGGNETELIDLFTRIKRNDWICSTWRSHYHCLLKGVDQEQMMSDIRMGRSISLCYPDQRVISSAIVAGCLPIAVGLAWSIKDAKKDEHVWAFIGDMAATTGMFSECVRYAVGHDLPVTFVIEDNGLSVCTDTKKTWGGKFDHSGTHVRYYKYHLMFPHSGTGKRIEF